MYKMANKQYKLTFPEHIQVSEKSKNFIKKCLEFDYSMRPDINEALLIFH